MKRIFILILMILFQEVSISQIVNGRFSTSVYSFEKFDTIGISSSYWRAFQTFQLDVTKERYSLHSLIQGNANFSGDVDEISNIKFYNLYFKIKKIFNVADFNLGRQYIFGGIANGLIDGAAIKLSLYDNKLILKSFGGAIVNKELKPEITKSLRNNYLLGFHLIGSPVNDLSLSVSYMNRHRERLQYNTIRPDTLGFVYNQLIGYPSSAEQFISGDVDYNFLNYGRLYARYDYDINMVQTSRLQFGTKVLVTNQIALIGEYIRRTPRLYFNSIFYVFQSNNTEEVEGGIEFSYKPNMKFYAKFANVQYSGDKANRYTIGMSTEYGSLFYAGSNGYAGELSSVSAQIFYPLLERRIIPTISVSRSSYKLTKNSDRYESFTGVFGAAVNLIKNISFDAQIHWLNNKVYKDDLRFLFKASYFFSQKLNIL
ncbi:MAG: hypothetical protein IGBAC_1872 [Ignavibacteriae bacterium]|nr:MAG: hypothetical protein IGBAC_1872 [Ignavibacteriota bacterium]